MSSSEKIRTALSLKSRIALSYAICFFISCIAIFAVLSIRVDASLNSSRDKACRDISRDLQRVYAFGNRYSRLHGVGEAGDYPEKSRRVIEKNYPESKILFFHRTPMRGDGEFPGRVFLTACIACNGEFYEVRADDDKIIFARKLNRNSRLADVQSLCDRVMQGEGRHNISIILLEDQKSDLLDPQRAVPEALTAGLPQKENGIIETNSFRYTASLLPDGKTLLVGWNTRARDVFRKRNLVLFFLVLSAAALFGIVITYLLTRRFLKGITATTFAMSRIYDGDYSYRIGISDNDREVLKLIETFNAMNERTEKLLTELKLMSDNVAHDLRTPLTRMSGTIELLLCDRKLDERTRAVCVSVFEETNRLKELVNTMMDISRTNSRPDELDLETIELNDLLRDLHEFMLPAFEDKNLDLRLTLPEEDISIRADRKKLQRLLANLLENALKFTDSGFVEISLRRAENGKIQLTVSDSGCGIPEAAQSKIFDRFFRADSSRHLPGNGLGLALVKAICDAHKWELSLRSVVGSGSAFTISF